MNGIDYSLIALIGTTVLSSDQGIGEINFINDANEPFIDDRKSTRFVWVDKNGGYNMYDPQGVYRSGEWEMFLDDERFPCVNVDTFIVRSTKEAIALCKAMNCLPNRIAFDHDLGGEDTSIKFIYWLCNQVLDKTYTLSPNFNYTVHSQNPVGEKNIRGVLDNFIKFISLVDKPPVKAVV